MSEQTKPEFNDILNLIKELPDYPVFNTDKTEPLSYLQEWLEQHSRLLDLSRGFLVNRCALYWTGYNKEDGFDGQAFVDSAQESNGALRQLAQTLDTDLQIFELDPHSKTKRSLDEIAMATSYGMMGVEENTQLFCATSFGQGVESTAQDALEAIKDTDKSIDQFMPNYCGLDHAALLGAAIACCLKGIPMITEGHAGRFVKTLLEKHTGQHFSNIILCDDLDTPINHDLPGQRLLLTAIMLKSLMTASAKTDCGKIKQVA